jgi:hypothetical protein
MTNSLPWYRFPIEIDGLPIKHGDFPWQTVSHNQMVGFRTVEVFCLIITCFIQVIGFISYEHLYGLGWSYCLFVQVCMGDLRSDWKHFFGKSWMGIPRCHLEIIATCTS